MLMAWMDWTILLIRRWTKDCKYKLNLFCNHATFYTVSMMLCYHTDFLKSHVELSFHEMLIIQDLKPTLNMQTDSIRAKLFT